MSITGIEWEEFNIKKDFTADDVATGMVKYGLSEYRNDLYQTIRDHVIPEGGEEFHVNLFAETMLLAYHLKGVHDDDMNKALDILMNPKHCTKMFGRVELKKMFNLTEENETMLMAILCRKLFDCEEMGMSPKQTEKAINKYFNKEIIDKFLNDKQYKSLSRTA